jgi:hypothetical protein
MRGFLAEHFGLFGFTQQLQFLCRGGLFSIFCHDCRPKCADQGTGDRGMGSVDVLRNKAEEYLEKARAISDRQRARLLLVQAHNYLKCAEETEAEQLSARR